MNKDSRRGAVNRSLQIEKEFTRLNAFFKGWSKDDREAHSNYQILCDLREEKKDLELRIIEFNKQYRERRKRHDLQSV